MPIVLLHDWPGVWEQQKGSFRGLSTQALFLCFLNFLVSLLLILLLNDETRVAVKIFTLPPGVSIV